jgi:hypothetical protein
MPAKRKASKKVSSFAEDSSISAGDSNAMSDGAAATIPAPNDAPKIRSE